MEPASLPKSRLLRCLMKIGQLLLLPLMVHLGSPSIAVAAAPATTNEGETPLPQDEARRVLEVAGGYRFVSANGDGGRAAEYEYLHPSGVAEFFFDHLGEQNKFSLHQNWSGRHDRRGELSYDHRGQYRFSLSTQSLWHNLGQEPLFSQPFNPFFSPTTLYEPVGAGEPGRGVEVREESVQFRYRPELFPVHLNLGYWRLSREGTRQLIYADHDFENSVNRFYSIGRRLDQETHEGSIGIDTHLGLIDVIYDFRIRQFDEHAATPTALFGTDPVVREHDADPDSRLLLHTVKLHTSLSGGLAAALSGSWGKRENRSEYFGFADAGESSAVVWNLAGDISYTPDPLLSFSVKYRRQDVDREVPSAITGPDGAVEVREPIDTSTDTLTATVTVRPAATLTLKGEYRGALIHREHLSGWVRPGSIATLSYPGYSETHTGSLSILGRPFKGLKYKAEYRYVTAAQPAYPNQPQEKHEISGQVTWNNSGRWGGSLQGLFSKENSDDLQLRTLNLNPGDASVVHELPRDRDSVRGWASLWVVPVQQLTVTGSCGILRSSTDQALLLVSASPGQTGLANYTNNGTIYALNGVYQWNSLLDLSLLLQQVRSNSEFEPGLGPSADAEIAEISRARIVQNSVAARADYRLTRTLVGGIEYTYSDYSDKGRALYDGSVNTFLINLAATW